MTAKPNRHLIVVYHEDCIDGLASAWAFDLKWGPDPNVHVSYIPYGHHTIPEAQEQLRKEMVAGSEIFFVDVAPSKVFLDELMSPLASGLPPAKAVRVMDHHKSAGEALAGYTPPVDAQAPKLEIHIDDHHPSADNMVWDTLLPDRKKPPFLEMIVKMDLSRDIKEEHDLAAAALIDSKNIRTIADAFSNFTDLSVLSKHDMVVAGQNILSDQQNRIQKLSDNVMYTRITLLNEKQQEEAIWVPVINADVQNFGRHISDYLREQGDRTGMGMAFAWYVQGNGTVTMSIRSDGNPDASKIAEVLCLTPGVKGGGHKTSSAVHFQSLKQFTDLIPLYTEAQMAELKKKDLSAPPVLPANDTANDIPKRHNKPKWNYPKFG